MTKKRIAIVTDSLSPDFYFPNWHAYYSAQFGPESIHVFAPPSATMLFESYELASVQLSSPSYDDNERLEAITQYVNQLLQSHDVVIRVDTDEFLIADPKSHENLASYVDQLDMAYVTARGFDVYQHAGEAPLDLKRPILGEQRRHAYALTAMCKTSITSMRMAWDRGFHMASAPPVFDDLYLFHLKRADICIQMQWNAFIASRITMDPFIRAYYETSLADIERFHADVSRRPVESSDNALLRPEYFARFLSGIQYDEAAQLWRYDHDLDFHNVQIPDRFWRVI